MKDNEIIKAFECCALQKVRRCVECPIGFGMGVDGKWCNDKVLEAVLDLIKRQQAEIERLNEEKARLDNTILYDLEQVNKIVEKATAESIKEFAEEFEKRCIASGVYPAVTKNILKKLVKEKTEVSNGE